MAIDPQTIDTLNSLTGADLGTIITTHGVLNTDGDQTRLVEVEADFRGDRFPVSIHTEGISEDDTGAYVMATGTLRATTDQPMFGTLELDVDAYDLFPTTLDDHASETSKQTTYETIDEIISEFSDPIPIRFLIETAVERGVDRDTAEDVLARMETAGNVYSPSTGMIGGM